MSLALACPLTLISYITLRIKLPLSSYSYSYIGFINNALLENPDYIVAYVVIVVP